jgi:hypothetical protein
LIRRPLCRENQNKSMMKKNLMKKLWINLQSKDRLPQRLASTNIIPCKNNEMQK